MTISTFLKIRLLRKRKSGPLNCLLVANSGWKPASLFSFQVTKQTFGVSDFTPFHPKHLLRSARCVPHRTKQGWGVGSNLGCCVCGRGCWRNTEKWPRFAAVPVLTSEFPPPSFKKSVLIWKVDAVANCIQNYQAYAAKLFFSRCQIRSKKIPAAPLFWPA